ncbi:WD_REPEATS_REGION domain-containing protein [Durusdinium trenchii]|uniref:WD_REPEATS_REGION domain-containing protein n=2 Tax=Durusdinium trenchii TaxID=1381693 RepID=A0ABP0H962_9DINO
MVFSWEKVNPDGAVDPLPLPFSIIDEVIEDVLEAVGEQVDAIEKRKRCAEYEFSLQEAGPSSFVQVPGRIACAYVEPRGTARMAVGTSQGEALLVDTRKGEVVAHAHPFPESEPVTCVSLCSESAYQEIFAGPGIDAPTLPSPPLKLFAAGVNTPKILVYDIQKEAYGILLKPACAIQLPKPEETEETEVDRPVIEQLHTRGVYGGVHVVALLPDRTVRVFLCPLGEPDLEDEANVVLDTPIAEGDEDDEEAEHEAGGPEEEFAQAPQVNTAMFSLSLTQLAPMRHLPMPELDTITLMVFSPRPRDGAYGVGVSAGQVPTLCFSSSVESNAVLAHFIPPPTPLAAPAGLELDELLMKEIPKHGVLPDPEFTKKLQPRRRWSMPAKTSATAVSPNGGIFAIGGCQGSLALVNTATGPSLRTMLPGHYGAINALNFHRDRILVSVGADCYVHQYCMQTDTLLARHLSSPPPEPAVVLGATACQTMPLAVTLDSEGSLRLWDLKRGCKIARMSCEGPIDDPKQKADTEEDPEATVKPVIKLEQDETPKLLLSTATAFCAICMSMGANEEHVEVEGGAEDEGAEAPEADAEGAHSPAEAQDRSWLVFFDQVQVLKKLFPSLPKGDVAKSFEALSKEELAKLQPQGVPSTMEKATLLSKKKPPEDPAARARSPPSKPTKTRLMSRSRSKLDTSNIMIMKLTAENLRKFAAAQAAQQEAAGGAKKVASSFGSAGFARSATLNTADRQKAEEAILPHGVPKNWQVSVRKHLKKALTGKDTRQSRIQKRIDQLKKEVGGE